MILYKVFPPNTSLKDMYYEHHRYIKKFTDFKKARYYARFDMPNGGSVFRENTDISYRKWQKIGEYK